jgi:hypothetical protein
VPLLRVPQGGELRLARGQPLGAAAQRLRDGRGRGAKPFGALREPRRGAARGGPAGGLRLPRGRAELLGGLGGRPGGPAGAGRGAEYRRALGRDGASAGPRPHPGHEAGPGRGVGRAFRPLLGPAGGGQDGLPRDGLRDRRGARAEERRSWGPASRGSRPRCGRPTPTSWPRPR